MKLAIPTIGNSDLEIANSAEIGVESLIKVSPTETLTVGDLKQVGGVYDWTPDNGFTALGGTLGRDLALICANGIKSIEEIVVVFAITMDGAGTPAGTAEARFAPPARVSDQSFNFPIGLAVDLKVLGTADQTLSITTVSGQPTIVVAETDPRKFMTAADVGKTIAGTGIPGATTILSVQGPKNFTLSANATAGATVVGTITARTNAARGIRTVTGVNSIVGGRDGNRFLLVSFPEDFVDVNCTTEKNPTLPISKTVAIGCGYNGSRWIKKGVSEPASLELTEKYKGALEGLMRLNGQRCTAMMEVWKEDYLLTERMIFGNWRPSTQPRKPDGEGNAEGRATGNYEIFGFFN